MLTNFSEFREDYVCSFRHDRTQSRTYKSRVALAAKVVFPHIRMNGGQRSTEIY